MKRKSKYYIGMEKQITIKRKGKILALLAFVTIFIGLLFFLFAGENFNVLKEIFKADTTREEVRISISKLGIRAYIVVFLLSMFQVLFTFVPAEPLHVIAGVSFGLWKGIAVCFSGIIVGNTIIYLLYKIFGSKLTDYFAANLDFDFDQAKHSKKIALIVILLYVLPAIPYGIICFFAATLGIKYPKYILITGIGSIPSLIVDVCVGHIAMSMSWTISIIIFVIIIVLLVLMAIYKKQIFEKINKAIAKSQEKQKNKVGDYNGLVCKSLGRAIYYFGVRPKVKVKYKSKINKIEEPSIVLCNHGSFYDFVYSGKLLLHKKPHFIVARMYFHDKRLAWIINKTGAFPKSLMATDVENMKNCFKVVKNKEILAMMPEGRLSTVGKFEGIQEATYKFIKKMNVPIYTIKIEGAYLAKPKWGDKLRKGAVVEVEANKLLSSEDVQNLSEEELKNKIESALDYDEWKWLDEHQDVIYKHKTIAEGLENILCVCPNCGNKYSLKTSKNQISCEKCDLEVSVDNRYQLKGVNFKNIAQWYEWQEDVFRKEIKQSEQFAIDSKVELRHLSTNGKGCTRHAGNGVCSLTRQGLLYKGTDDGKEIEKLFPLKTVYRILFGAGEDFEVYEDKELFYFVPENKRSCVAWYILSKLLQE